MTEMLKNHIIAGTVLLVVLLILFHSVFFEDRVLLPLDQLNTMNLPYSARYDSVQVFNHFLNDAIVYFYIAKVITRENLLAGIIDYWNPYLFGGYPQYATTHAAHFDMTNLLLLVGDLPFSYHLQILVQLLIAGFGMYLLLRHFSVGQMVAVVFALAYMLNSIFMTTLLHRWIVASFCWVPYVVLTLQLFFVSRRSKYAVLCSIFVALSFFGGSFQTSAYVVFVVVVFGIVRSTESMSVKSLTGNLVVVAVIVLVAVALTASMWLPSLEMWWLDILDGGSRTSGIHKHYPVIQRLLSVPLLITFLIPELAGNVRAFDMTKIAGASLDEFIAFAGVVPLLFGTWGSFYLWKRKKESRPFSILMFLGLFVPVATPLYSYLYHRFFIVFIFGLVVVGAIAFDALIKERNTWQYFRRWHKNTFVLTLLVFAALLAVNIVASLNYTYYLDKATDFVTNNLSQGQLAAGNEAWMLGRVGKTFEHFSILSPSMYIPFALLFLSLFLLHQFGRSRLSPATTTVSLGAVMCVQLLSLAWSWLPMTDTHLFPMYPRTRTTDLLKKDTTCYRVLPVTLPGHQRVLPPNILYMYKVATLTGYDGIFPRVVSQLFADTGNTQVNPGALGLANVKYILINPEADIHDSSLTLVDSSEIKVYLNRKWKDRAYMAYRYEVLANEHEVFKRFHGSDNDGSVVFFDNPPTVNVNREGSSVRHSVKISKSGNNELLVEVETAEEGYLVLSDTFYPGWNAYLNSSKVEIMKGNYAMRVVYVPAGKSAVEFRFEPDLFKYGSWLSLTTALACLFIVGQGFSRK
jgi:hypothetical protein